MLPGYQRKYLRGLAHDLEPLVHLGKEGLTDTLAAQVRLALDHHELIKVRLTKHKEERDEIGPALAVRADAELVGTIGNVLILYRPSDDPDKRRIELPRRPGEGPARALEDEDR